METTKTSTKEDSRKNEEQPRRKRLDNEHMSEDSKMRIGNDLPSPVVPGTKSSNNRVTPMKAAHDNLQIGPESNRNTLKEQISPNNNENTEPMEQNQSRRGRSEHEEHSHTDKSQDNQGNTSNTDLEKEHLAAESGVGKTKKSLNLDENRKELMNNNTEEHHGILSDNNEEISIKPTFREGRDILIAPKEDLQLENMNESDIQVESMENQDKTLKITDKAESKPKRSRSGRVYGSPSSQGSLYRNIVNINVVPHRILYTDQKVAKTTGKSYFSEEYSSEARQTSGPTALQPNMYKKPQGPQLEEQNERQMPDVGSSFNDNRNSQAKDSTTGKKLPEGGSLKDRTSLQSEIQIDDGKNTQQKEKQAPQVQPSKNLADSDATPEEAAGQRPRTDFLTAKVSFPESAVRQPIFRTIPNDVFKKLNEQAHSILNSEKGKETVLSSKPQLAVRIPSVRTDSKPDTGEQTLQPAFQPKQPTFQLQQPLRPAFQPKQPSFQPKQKTSQPQQTFQPLNPTFQPKQPTFQSIQFINEPKQQTFQPKRPNFLPPQPTLQRQPTFHQQPTFQSQQSVFQQSQMDRFNNKVISNKVRLPSFHALNTNSFSGVKPTRIHPSIETGHPLQTPVSSQQFVPHTTKQFQAQTNAVGSTQTRFSQHTASAPQTGFVQVPTKSEMVGIHSLRGTVPGGHASFVSGQVDPQKPTPNQVSIPTSHRPQSNSFDRNIANSGQIQQSVFQQFHANSLEQSTSSGVQQSSFHTNRQTAAFDNNQSSSPSFKQSFFRQPGPVREQQHTIQAPHLGTNSAGQTTFQTSPNRGQQSIVHTFHPEINTVGHNTFQTSPINGQHSMVEVPNPGANTAGQNTFQTSPNRGQQSIVHSLLPGANTAAQNTFQSSSTRGQQPIVQAPHLGANTAGQNTFQTSPNRGQQSIVHSLLPGANTAAQNTFQSSPTRGQQPIVQEPHLGANTAGQNTFQTSPNRGQQSIVQAPHLGANAAGQNTFQASPNRGQQSIVQAPQLGANIAGQNTFQTGPNMGQQPIVHAFHPETNSAVQNTFQSGPTRGQPIVQAAHLGANTAGKNTFQTSPVRGQHFIVPLPHPGANDVGKNTFKTSPIRGQQPIVQSPHPGLNTARLPSFRTGLIQDNARQPQFSRNPVHLSDTEQNPNLLTSQQSISNIQPENANQVPSTRDSLNKEQMSANKDSAKRPNALTSRLIGIPVEIGTGTNKQNIASSPTTSTNRETPQINTNTQNRPITQPTPGQSAKAPRPDGIIVEKPLNQQVGQKTTPNDLSNRNLHFVGRIEPLSAADILKPLNSGRKPAAKTKLNPYNGFRRYRVIPIQQADGSVKAEIIYEYQFESDEGGEPFSKHEKGVGGERGAQVEGQLIMHDTDGNQLIQQYTAGTQGFQINSGTVDPRRQL